MNKSDTTVNYIIVTDHFGNKTWYKKCNSYNEYHREDAPAFEGVNGDKEYWVNDQLHRIDGPAVEYADGEKQWFVNDIRHRIDGPAVIWADGNVEYWINGKRYSSLEEGLMDQAIG